MKEARAVEGNMARRVLRSSLRRPLFLRGVTMLLAVLVLGGLGAPSLSAEEPQRDPAGTATGDKTNAVDAGGNSFVVSEPTDKTAPDYADKKKAYDEYQAQLAKEPLAAKLADSVGHTPIPTNFSWTLLTGYLILFMQAVVALLPSRLVVPQTPPPPPILYFPPSTCTPLPFFAVCFCF